MELKGAILVWFSTKASYKNKTLTKNKHKEKNYWFPHEQKTMDQPH
jgi:hypothetical protein